MKIGIVGAIEEEIIILRNKIENRQNINVGNSEIYIGQLSGMEIILLKSGIGKVAAALGVTILLDRYKPDIIINTGSAGSLTPILKVGDIIISNEVCYHDVDITVFGYKLGQIPNFPAIFKADKKLISAAVECSTKLSLNAVCGLIVSGDIFINGSISLEKIRYKFPQAIAVEMEAAAIAHVCYNFGIPFIVIRTISDLADQQAYHKFYEFLDVVTEKSSLMVEKLVRKLNCD